MAHTQEATARQLDFTDTGREGCNPVRPSVAKTGPVPLCAVCGRLPARLTVERERGHLPARLCLRCHHGVMRQRRMLRAILPAAGSRHESLRPHRFEGDARLIVARHSELSPEGRTARLAQSRRRAQVAARRALDLDIDLGEECQVPR
jgi:hypothetical protein